MATMSSQHSLDPGSECPAAPDEEVLGHVGPLLKGGLEAGHAAVEGGTCLPLNYAPDHIVKR